MRGVHKDIMVLVRKARSLGWKVTQTRNGHLMWKGPNGEGPVTTVSKVGDPRTLNNMLRDLRAAGLDLGDRPGTVGQALVEAALKKQEKVRITPEDLGENRPECNASEVIIRHPRKDNTMPTEKNKSRGIRTAGRTSTILTFMRNRPNQPYPLREVANSLSMAESTAASALGRMVNNPDIPIERVSKGVYLYREANGNGHAEPAPVVEAPAPTPAPTQTHADNVMLVEVVKVLGNDRLLVQDEHGNLYTMKPLEV